MSTQIQDYQLIDVSAFAPNLGAEIRGVSLADGISDAQFAEINRAFLQYQVLFFKDQAEIPPDQHVNFGKRFGPLHVHPAAPTMDGHPEIFEIHVTKNSKVANGEHWHSDVSCDKEPPMAQCCNFISCQIAAVTQCSAICMPPTMIYHQQCARCLTG